MATTSELLTWVELECHGWNREGPRGTRALLNEAQKLLLLNECMQTLIYDSTTGNLPFLTTVAGTYRYTIPALDSNNVWMIGAVVVDSLSASGLDYGGVSSGRTWQLEQTRISGSDYYRVINIRSIPWNGNADAQLTFIGVDPGATSSLYRIVAYKRPSEILSDSIQHEMPGSCDVDYLMPAAMKLIEAIDDHGKMIEARRYIRNELRPQMWAELNRGEQGTSRFVTRRAY
jgi:hypothetical protein